MIQKFKSNLAIYMSIWSKSFFKYPELIGNNKNFRKKIKLKPKNTKQNEKSIWLITGALSLSLIQSTDNQKLYRTQHNTQQKNSIC